MDSTWGESSRRPSYEDLLHLVVSTKKRRSVIGILRQPSIGTRGGGGSNEKSEAEAPEMPSHWPSITLSRPSASEKRQVRWLPCTPVSEIIIRPRTEREDVPALHYSAADIAAMRREFRMLLRRACEEDILSATQNANAMIRHGEEVLNTMGREEEEKKEEEQADYPLDVMRDGGVAKQVQDIAINRLQVNTPTQQDYMNLCYHCVNMPPIAEGNAEEADELQDDDNDQEAGIELQEIVHLIRDEDERAFSNEEQENATDDSCRDDDNASFFTSVYDVAREALFVAWSDEDVLETLYDNLY